MNFLFFVYKNRPFADFFYTALCQYVQAAPRLKKAQRRARTTAARQLLHLKFNLVLLLTQLRVWFQIVLCWKWTALYFPGHHNYIAAHHQSALWGLKNDFFVRKFNKHLVCLLKKGTRRAEVNFLTISCIFEIVKQLFKSSRL